jgi:quinoprotein glucose dehydrogenase
LKQLGFAAILALSGSSLAFAQNGDYRYYNGDPGGTHYSRLTQINARNVRHLHQVWRYELDGNSELENTPIVVDGTLYGTGTGKIFALDGATGAVKWTYKPELPRGHRGAFNSRGESWWSNGRDRRLLVTVANFVYSLDPATGQPDPAFGEHGRIDLNDNLRGDPSLNYVRMGGAVTIWHDLFFTCGEVGEESPAPPATSVPGT